MKGLAVSKGIGIGQVVVLQSSVKVKKEQITNIEKEISKFEESQGIAEKQIEEIMSSDHLEKDKQAIFKAHLMMLRDPEFSSGVKMMIKESSCNAAYAVDMTGRRIMDTFLSLNDPYFQERASDIKDISYRVICVLTDTQLIFEYPKYPHILVADDLAPSQTALIDPTYTKGIITKIGGETSHSAIIARSLSIPAVMGLGEAVNALKQDNQIIVDGTNGDITLEPDPDCLAYYNSKLEEQRAEERRLLAFKDMSFSYDDGRPIEIAGNIATAEEAEQVLNYGGEGVGLFRSEFIYMNRMTAPTEEDQFKAYKKALQALEGKPLTIRTMDIGGDKEVDFIHIEDELNPFLGFRAIRYCLEDRVLFKTQLSALYRASVFGRLRIMFPMISSVSEIIEVKAIIEDVLESLDTRSIPYDRNVDIGIMIEIPSAAIMADVLAKEVDFASIGTNDLTQYTLACDRMNANVSHIYSNYDPSVIRMIEMVINHFHGEGKWVGMCGSAAGNPELIPLWHAFGLDEFSMTPASIPKAKEIISRLSKQKNDRLKVDIMSAPDKEAVQDILKKYELQLEL